MKRLFILILLFSATPIFAQLEGNPENWCRSGFFPRESRKYSTRIVNGKKGEKIYFYGDDGDCPNGKDCRRKNYVVRGDEVIVSRTFGNWACAWFQPEKGSETVGWLPNEKLGLVQIVQEIDDLIGNWRYGENSIVISKGSKSRNYKIVGKSFWKGLGNNVHIGELDDKGKLFEDDLKLGEDGDENDCKVTMKLIGNFLIVSDNNLCGGANVTFSGVYVKK